MLGFDATFDDFTQKGMSLANRKCSVFCRLNYVRIIETCVFSQNLLSYGMN